jgi:hypothetical protein
MAMPHTSSSPQARLPQSLRICAHVLTHWITNFAVQWAIAKSQVDFHSSSTSLARGHGSHHNARGSRQTKWPLVFRGQYSQLGRQFFILTPYSPQTVWPMARQLIPPTSGSPLSHLGLNNITLTLTARSWDGPLTKAQLKVFMTYDPIRRSNWDNSIICLEFGASFCKVWSR